MNRQPNQDDYEEEFEDEDIEAVQEHFERQRNHVPVRRRSRGRSNSWAGPVVMVVLFFGIVGVGYFVWSTFATKIPSGVVTTNPTANAMNTEASVILTQVSGGSNAIMVGSTPDPATVYSTPAGLPTLSCRRTITDLGAYEEQQSYYYVYAENPEYPAFVDKQTWSTLQRGQVLDYCN
jgi:hypothetical protein